MREIYILQNIVQGGDAVATARVAESEGGKNERGEGGGGRRKWRKEKVKSLWMEGKCKVGGIVRELEALKIMQIRLPPQHAVNGTKRGLPDSAEIER